MKKSNLSILIVIVIVIVAVIWYAKSSSSTPSQGELTATTTAPVSVSETTKVSSQISEYQNAELGFLVKYPSAWNREELGDGVNFIIPIDQTQVSTVATLQASIKVLAGTCAFPPVTTIKDRGTLKSGDMTFNTISMSNSVQGRNYFNRMYSLQKDSICYIFSFASIAQSGSSKGLTGSKLTQAENNNKAIIADAEAAFTTLIKSFAFVTGPQGKDEGSVAPAR